MLTVALATVILLALWALAARYGYDSRDGLRSKEQELASYGVTWREVLR